MSRTSWLAIRAPLSPRRATIAKISAFLLPLAAWILLCIFWVPDVIVIDQGEGVYKPGDRVERDKFDRENARIVAARKEKILKMTDQSFQTLRSGGVPDDVIKKLEGIKGSWEDAASLSFVNRDDLFKNFKYDLEKEEFEKYKDKILDSAEQRESALMIGDPSTKIWLPTPLKVAKAFYHAFVTPPRGTEYKITDEVLIALRDKGMSDSVVSKLAPLKNRAFAYNDRDKFQGAVSQVLSQDEFEKNRKRILNYSYHRGDDPWLHESLLHSCWIIFCGFMLSAIVGVPLGIFCGTFDLFSKLTEPFVDFIRYMPAPAFGVLCVAVLDIEDRPKIAMIWIGTFFQMVLVVANTTRQFDESLLEAAQTLGATKRSLLTKVILPGILPALYNDMRILIGWAWTYLIVAEVLGSSSGISYFINQQGRYRHFDNVYAGIIMIGIIGLVFDQILAALSRVLFPWMPRNRGPGAWGAFFTAMSMLPKWLMGRMSSAGAPPRSHRS